MGSSCSAIFELKPVKLEPGSRADELSLATIVVTIVVTVVVLAPGN
jgi:hypothetical protein